MSPLAFNRIAGGSWLGLADLWLRVRLQLRSLLTMVLFMAAAHLALAVGYAWPELVAVWEAFRAYVLAEWDAHRLPGLYRVVEYLSAEWDVVCSGVRATSLVWVGLPILWGWFVHRSWTLGTPRHRRGSRMVEAPWRASSSSPAAGLNLGTVWLGREDEIRHVLCLGRPGVGKTVLFRGVLEQLLARDEHAKILVYDYKGDYLATFARAGDLLFNPLDRRSVSWNIFSDLTDVMDIDAVCQSLVPESREEDRFWLDAARAVLSGILHLCWQQNTRTNAAIWHWLTRPTKELATALASIPQGHRGWKAIEDASSKQALGVMATLMLYAKPFEYMAYWAGGWSVRTWLTTPGARVLFVSNTPRVKDTLKPILSLCIDLLGRTLLSLPDDLERRVYFIIDEFGTLQRLSTVTDLLTLSRSKGGSVWLGIQDLGQIDRLYREDVRQTIVNACGNTVVFALADPKTQQYVSQLIGEVEYDEPELSHRIAADRHGSFSVRRQVKTAPLILPSELQSLPDLTALIRTSSSQGLWQRTQLVYQPRPTVCLPFEPLPQLLLHPQQTEGGSVRDPEGLSP